MILYSASIDGWINVIDARRAVMIDALEISNGNISSMIGDSVNMRFFVA
jgi:hypothetical protein